MLFNKEISDEKYFEVKNKYMKLCGDWSPRQTNGDELYKDTGCDWAKINISKLKTIDWYDSWKDMPQKAIEYIKSLNEFDAKIFKEITGLDGEPEKMTMSEVCKALGKTIKIKK